MFSNVFRRYRKPTPGCNGLSRNTRFNWCKWRILVSKPYKITIFVKLLLGEGVKQGRLYDVIFIVFKTVSK